MRFILFVVTFISLNWAHGQLPNLPDAAGLTQVGRVHLFVSVQPLSWFTPTAFSHQLECTQNLSGSKRTCSIKIFNQLNAQETKKLEEMAQKNNLQILTFSQIDAQVVNGIQESFKNMPADLNGQVMSLKTLALTEGLFPYASYMFRAEKDRVAEIEEAYDNEGVGEFLIQFKMNVQNTQMYLAIKDGGCLKKNLLSQQQQQLSKLEVKNFLLKTINACQLTSVAYEPQEARDYMMYHLRDTFFEYSKIQGFQLKGDAVEKITDRYTLHSDVGEPQTLDCETRVVLQKNSVAQTQCRSPHGDTL